MLPATTYARVDEFLRIGNLAVAKAQEESRRLNVPNVYCINGRIYYELPSGELSLVNPNANGHKPAEEKDKSQ